MTDEREYYKNMKEIRNGEKSPIDPVNSYYDIDQEDIDEYTKGLGVFAGCAIAVAVTAGLMWSVWYACSLIFS